MKKYKYLILILIFTLFILSIFYKRYHIPKIQNPYVVQISEVATTNPDGTVSYNDSLNGYMLESSPTHQQDELIVNLAIQEYNQQSLKGGYSSQAKDEFNNKYSNPDNFVNGEYVGNDEVDYPTLYAEENKPYVDDATQTDSDTKIPTKEYHQYNDNYIYTNSDDVVPIRTEADVTTINGEVIRVFNLNSRIYGTFSGQPEWTQTNAYCDSPYNTAWYSGTLKRKSSFGHVISQDLTFFMNIY